ncbi:MUC1 protein, partial [Nothoprocta ornata]|nr:MUC1 protein [Nothoprocta ornata]
VPPWAIALLVLVSVLVLLIVLLFCLMTTCSCRRKSRGKLFSAKDSYEPAAEYPPYQSHGRYAAPAGKHSPYSQVGA